VDITGARGERAMGNGNGRGDGFRAFVLVDSDLEGGGEEKIYGTGGGLLTTFFRHVKPAVDCRGGGMSLKFKRMIAPQRHLIDQ